MQDAGTTSLWEFMMGNPIVMFTGSRCGRRGRCGGSGGSRRGGNGDGAGQLFQFDFINRPVDGDSVLFHVCFSLSLHFFHGNDADAGDVGAQLLRQRGGYGGYQLRCYLTGGLGRSRDRCRGGLFPAAHHGAHEIGQRDQADQPEEHRAHAHETDKNAAVLHTILPFVIPPPGNSAPPLAEHAPACVGGKVLWLSYHAGAEKQRVL